MCRIQKENCNLKKNLNTLNCTHTWPQLLPSSLNSPIDVILTAFVRTVSKKKTISAWFYCKNCRIPIEVAISGCVCFQYRLDFNKTSGSLAVQKIMPDIITGQFATNFEAYSFATNTTLNWSTDWLTVNEVSQQQKQQATT